jgi:hypothetical protein
MQLSILLPDGALSTIELPEEDGVDLNELAVELVAAVSAHLLTHSHTHTHIVLPTYSITHYRRVESFQLSSKLH